MKKLGLVSLLTVLVLLLAACGGGGSIEGTWKLTNVSGSGADDQFAQAMALINSVGGSLTLSFQGGTMTMKMEAMGQTESNTGSYKVEGDKLDMEGTSITFSVNGNTLTLTDGSTKMEFTRQ